MNHDMGQAENRTQHENAYSESGTSPPQPSTELIARLYHAHHLVPVPLDPFEKKPMIKGWADATARPSFDDLLPRWRTGRAGIGLVTGQASGIVVVDVDPRNGVLRASGLLVVSLVAEEAGEIVGHVALSPVSAGASPGGLGLAPLAVASGCRRRGVGDALVRGGLDASRRAGCAFVVVLGEPAYYERFGFTVASGWGLVDQYGAGSAFQVLELRPGGVPRGAGLVRYAEEFALLSARPEDDAP